MQDKGVMTMRKNVTLADMVKDKGEIKDVARKFAEESLRGVRLTVRLTADDRARLESLRVKMSPYAPLSLGKALSAAIQIADESLSKRK